MTQFLNVQPGCEAPDFSFTTLDRRYDHGVSSRHTESSSRSRFLGESFWTAMVGAICAHFTLVYNLNNRPFLNLSRYAAGQESLPFQARVLMAWIFRALAGRSFISAVASRLPVHDPYIAIQIFISFVTLFGAITFTRGSLYLLTSHSTFSRWAALLVAFMAYFNLPFVYGLAYTLPYDLPSLFFFTGCIFCVLRRSYFLFYLLFMLGIFNRETICFVTLFFLVWELSQTRLQDLPRASISRTGPIRDYAARWPAGSSLDSNQDLSEAPFRIEPTREWWRRTFCPPF